MSYQVTARTASDVISYIGIGERDQLMDAAYLAGALGVTIVAIV
jgi:hypothetical protein